MSTALLIYADGSEDLEITAPADVLTRGGVRVTRAAVAPDGRTTVTLAHGTRVVCDVNIAACHGPFDLIVVPGGLPGSEYCRDSKPLIALLREQQAAGRYIGAICAAPGFVLATHGIITDGPATGYPGCEAGIRNYTGRDVEHDAAHRIITGRGPGLCLSFALELLRALEGPQVASKVAEGMLITAQAPTR